LEDPRFEGEVKQMLEEQKFTKPEKYRPSWQGFSDEIEALYDLSDDIRLLIKLMAKVDIAPRPRPEGPADRVKAQLREFGLSRIQELLEQDAS
jgi:hypothetical protein